MEKCLNFRKKYLRFGSGYTLTLRATPEMAHSSAEQAGRLGGSAKNLDGGPGGGPGETLRALKDLVARSFPLAELKEEHYNQVREKTDLLW